MLHHVALIRTDVPLKRWFLQEPRGMTSQKTAFFIVTTLKTSTLTSVKSFSLIHYFGLPLFLFCTPKVLYNDCLCSLVVRVPGYRRRGPWFDSRCYQIFWEVVGLEQGPPSLVSIAEDLHERESSGSSLENRLTVEGIRCTDCATPLPAKVGTTSLALVVDQLV
jgi:hypothetical protein